MSKKLTIYHNPRCSKSRQTLALIEQKGLQPEVVLYLETPPNADQIKSILAKLEMHARDLLRTGEEAYKALNLKNPDLSEMELIQAMANNPKLIERPIVVKGEKALIGRPPDKVNKLL